jgi:hypothetical protein
LITLTAKGRDCIAAGMATVDGIEQQLTELMGERGHGGCGGCSRKCSLRDSGQRSGIRGKVEICGSASP